MAGLPQFLSWFGGLSSRELSLARGLTRKVLAKGESLKSQSEAELGGMASALRNDALAGRDADSLLVETYAMACEVAWRKLGMRPFPSQIMGAVAMHRGRIVEMKTGEGKTLAASLPATLHGLSGRGVHVVTVNDYLASRDAALLGPLYAFFGLEVGVITEDLDADLNPAGRKSAYTADVTYVTNHELVFDYLRDNLAQSPDEIILRPLHFALVDEVDFLLLDEARTPLIISGEAGDETDLCEDARRIVSRLKVESHYRVDHRSRQVMPTEAGILAMEKAAGIKNLADEDAQPWQHAFYNALLAHVIYEKDVDYIVEEEEGKVLLVDEYTGRVSSDKRLADGLHQALEAKEGMDVRPEDRTLAKTSYQNYFRLYPSLSGMTGTAWSAREEFGSVYGLKVVRVPTHKPMIRKDLPSRVYRSGEEKFQALVERISELQAEGRPVLVGTTSVRESEFLSRELSKTKIEHQVLNAKQHTAEAEIIAQAGRPRAVTVSTNMAGRGVDILLGGCPSMDADKSNCQKLGDQVRQAGGLAVVGTGLHEAARIDDQLRGRSGRQGDPGTSEYFLSLDDPLYKKFGEILDGAPVLTEMRHHLAQHPKGRPIRDWNVLRTLEGLRKKVEMENEAGRKDVLKYDMVIEEQRQQIFAWRRRLLGLDDNPMPAWQELTNRAADDLLARHGQMQDMDEEGLAGLGTEAKDRFAMDLTEVIDPPPKNTHAIEEAISAHLKMRFHELEKEMGAEPLTELSRQVLLEQIDDAWTEHLSTLERIDEGIGLRSYAELDPALEFKREAAALYENLLILVRLEALQTLLNLDKEDEEAINIIWLKPTLQRQHRKNLKR